MSKLAAEKSLNPNLARRSSLRPTSGSVILFVSKRSASCRAAWLYILQNKIHHEIVDIDDGTHEKANLLDSLNPHDKVPCLLDGDIIVHEMPAIIFYLAEKYTHFQGLGSNPGQRAKTEAIMCWTSASLSRSTLSNYVYPKSTNEEHLDLEVLKELSQKGATELQEISTTLEKQYLGKNKYLTGKDATFADYYVAVVLTSLDLVSFNFKLYPKLKQWLKQIKMNQGDSWELVCETHNMQVMQRGSRRASLM